MLPLGHVAAALSTSDLLQGDSRVAAVASQIPDLIDKPLAWVFHTTESSRFLAHTMIAATTSVALAFKLAGSRGGRGVLAGYASHLVGDQVTGGKVPFLWPVKRYTTGHKGFRLSSRGVLIELAAAAYLYFRWSRQRS